MEIYLLLWNIDDEWFDFFIFIILLRESDGGAIDVSRLAQELPFYRVFRLSFLCIVILKHLLHGRKNESSDYAHRKNDTPVHYAMPLPHSQNI